MDAHFSMVALYHLWVLTVGQQSGPAKPLHLGFSLHKVDWLWQQYKSIPDGVALEEYQQDNTHETHLSESYTGSPA